MSSLKLKKAEYRGEFNIHLLVQTKLEPQEGRLLVLLDRGGCEAFHQQREPKKKFPLKKSFKLNGFSFKMTKKETGAAAAQNSGSCPDLAGSSISRGGS